MARSDKPKQIITLKILKTEGGLNDSQIETTIYTLKALSKLMRKNWGISSSDPELNNLLLPLKSLAIKIFGHKDKNKRLMTRNQKKRLKTTTARNSRVIPKFGIHALRAEKGHRLLSAYEKMDRIPKIQGRGQGQYQSIFHTDSHFLQNKQPQVNPKAPGPRRKCYICKSTPKPEQEPHFFYDRLCLKCGEFNYSKRSQTGYLTGKIALVTGGRIKIGFEVCLKLLRAGATTVIVTTRFPKDAYFRYSQQSDFSAWKDALIIYGLDLRFLGDVEQFCTHILKTHKRLDILIQNAAQTIQRPPEFYKHLIQGEMSSSLQDPPQICQTWPKSLQIMTYDPMEERSSLTKSDQRSKKYFPVGAYDLDHQQVDLRPINSWILELDQVETLELVEVNCINYMAPFIILKRLTQLLRASAPFTWVILVSAMEGKFNRGKTTKHPHTNAPKAALNMLVRTSAPYYRDQGILLNAVDTGWVTREEPHLFNHGLTPPLDEVDGASRILDPIFQTINHGVVNFGNFLKDYQPTDW